MDNYCIKEGYTVRLDNAYCDDTWGTDFYQKEVYDRARELVDQNNFNVVYDIGTGSGCKLLKYFSDKETVGFDLQHTVDWLNAQYPGRHWWTFNPNWTEYNCDLLICADVIEHMVDPDELMDTIKRCNPKIIVLSTPDRAMLPEVDNVPRQDGPPKNVCHVREWNQEELKAYVSRHFIIREQYISNVAQCTQVIVASLMEK